MKPGLIQRVVGIFFMAFSCAMLPPILVSIYYADNSLAPFLLTFVGAFAIGILLWLPTRNDNRDLRVREGFLIVALFWLVASAVCSVPFHLAHVPYLPFTDAMFETVSALTTTGATVITGIDALPPAMLWYRQQLQWIGGFGVAVIAMAILPILGVGGMQLYRSEASGPSKQDKLTPRLRGTIINFSKVYAALTLLCAAAYWLAGMSLFDAVAHSFSTLSTGGFSTHDTGIAWFQNDLIELICMIFMLAGGISFALHFTVLRTLKFHNYWRHAETRTFLLIVLATSVVSAVYLVASNPQASVIDRVMNASFHAVSVLTSTGFVTEGFSGWPTFLPVVLIFLSIMGGCAGSTSGGMKTVRTMMVFKQGVREVSRVVHPNGVRPVKLGNRIVADRVMEAIWGFFAAYTLTYVFLMLLFLASGLDQVTAFSAVAATLNNLGPGLGDVASNFIGVSEFGKWVGIAGMLLGRMEIFVLIVILSPEFWRQ